MYICELSKGKDKEREARYNLAVYVRHKYSKYGKATKEISTNRRTDQGRQLQAIIGRWVVGKIAFTSQAWTLFSRVKRSSQVTLASKSSVLRLAKVAKSTKIPLTSDSASFSLWKLLSTPN